MASIVVLGFIFVVCVSSTNGVVVPHSSLECGQHCQSSLQRCRMTTFCENCEVAYLGCFNVAELEPIYETGFNDSFCGPALAMIYDRLLDNLTVVPEPLRCSNTSTCPSVADCTPDPAHDTTSYCCAREEGTTTAGPEVTTLE
ncbi:uncharacterized protein LOC101852332 [Aplysia californica]|uniref:Uncharacterized protein LOC101852332 n=1 Tax=Aplysia californica TaxID=6500 RepID=A0ABM0JUD0_APLCA|nr:uncharacterized protein LOC101852332 [Aplysia californica]